MGGSIVSDTPSQQQIQSCLQRVEKTYTSCKEFASNSKSRCIQVSVDHYTASSDASENWLNTQRKRCDEYYNSCLAGHWQSGSGGDGGAGSAGSGGSVDSVGVWGFISDEDRKLCEDQNEECYKKVQKDHEDTMSSYNDFLVEMLLKCEDTFEKDIQTCSKDYNESTANCISHGVANLGDAIGNTIYLFGDLIGTINPQAGGIPILLPHSMGEGGLFRGRSVFD
jgi:hypothetical protein